MPITILSHLGHSIDYNLVCEIETAEADLTQTYARKIQLEPELTQDDSPILTFWWADNFNRRLETQTGHGVINSTHIVEFSEPSDENVTDYQSVSLVRTKRRSLETAPVECPSVNVNRKMEPEHLVLDNANLQDDENQTIQELSGFKNEYMIWFLSRLHILASNDQLVPIYPGYQVRSQLSVGPIQQTKLEYLPPLNEPITDFATMYKLFKLIQSRAKQAKVQYANLTLDVGAAMNAFKVLWNYPDDFKNIVLHLEDFHFIKEMFSIIGNLIAGSGFEDIIFQAGICFTGSLNGVLCGSHYNRCWTVHAHLSEALERLLFDRFLKAEGNIPEGLEDVFDNRRANETVLDSVSRSKEVSDFLQRYERFKQQIRDGCLEKTAQFWLVYYLDIMENQHLLHTSIQSNNFYLHLFGWKQALLYAFALDKQNYARYGTIYLNNLQNLEITHPGCRELIQSKGISVQGQARYACRTAIDQRGEQTINRSAKTSGGIKYFASDPHAITKWKLNRAEQAKNTEALLELAGVHTITYSYKSTRPSQILKSETFVKQILTVLTQEYINPFDESLDETALYNLISGVPIDNELAESIFSVKVKGEQLFNEFCENRI